MSSGESLASLIRQFMTSKAILTACELDIFTILAQMPRAAASLAEEKGCDHRALTRLLDCLVTLDLLVKEQGIYRPTEQGELLSSGHEESLLPMAMHMNHTWNNWHHLTEAVQKGENPAMHRGSEFEGEEQKSFIEDMHAGARRISRNIAREYNADSFQRLLDIGGGSGAYTIAFLEENPHMEAILFDLEGVIPIARDKVRQAGLEARVQFTHGDYYNQELPRGCDLALLSAIIHQNSPEENLDLLSKIYRALEPGGRLLIRDYIMDEDRIKPAGGAMFALNMLVNTRGGDTYTFAEVEAGLQQAGFRRIHAIRTGAESHGRMDYLVEARK
ncbi:MAG TPA: methyltransferase domain-containing protein [Dehalococcoidia bacterium]|nr:methyltransferase domain-containing protein [Dehalococcoidia bacterium]